jgi:poly(ADP-ribose) glycohydrolase ARH3
VLTDDESTWRHAARGALLGTACGDAVGAPSKGSRVVSGMLVENGLSSSRPLRYTDDTTMTLVLARHLIATGGTIEENRIL